MITKTLKRMAFCLLVVLVAGFISAAAEAQEAGSQSPLLLIKIRNVEQFITDAGRLMPQVANQLATVRMVLQGTDWIDAGRSLTIGVAQDGATSRAILLVPFRTANAGFQAALNAKARQDYYIASIPPQPAGEVNPEIEEALRKASLIPAFGSISLEASMGRILAMIEPQMEAALKKVDASQLPKTGQPGLPPVDPQIILRDMLGVLRQVETVRMGVGLDGDLLTLQYDMNAMPNTMLAGIMVDPKRDTRLMNYPVDLPVQFRTRAPDFAGMMELTKLVYGQLYRQLGINLDEIAELNNSFTGEFAGGMSIDAGGLALEAIYVLKSGIDGKDFVNKMYLPWMERYGGQISEMAAKQNANLQGPIYKRTADSVVDGIEVTGLKIDLSALMPSGEKAIPGLEKLALEMRIAAAGDLMFVASDDAKMAAAIRKSRSLATAPAQGPTTLVNIKLGSLIKGIQSFLAVKKDQPAALENLGDLAIKAEVRDGKMTTRMSLNVDEIGKLMSAFQTPAAKK